MRFALPYNAGVITWAGFLAKLFQFCIERIASKKVDIVRKTLVTPICDPV